MVLNYFLKITGSWRRWSYHSRPSPEEDAELCDLNQNSELDFIRLITPTTLGDRLPFVLEKASGFIYYVSIAGITGTKSAQMDLYLAL